MNDQIQVQNTPGADPSDGKFDNLNVEMEGSFVRVTSPIESAPKPEAKPEAKPEEKKEPVKDERPAWLPEKFKSAEDMAKAYSELEKKLSQKPDEKKPEEKKDDKPADEKKDGEKKDEKKPEEKKDDRPTNEEREEVKSVLKKVDLDITKFEDEFDRDGKLSDESYASLEKAGFSKRFVDSYVEGQRALVTKAMDEVWAVSGGTAETYQEMTTWMTRSLPVEELKAYNAEIMKPDRKHVLSTVEAMHKRFTEANGKPGTLVQGKASGSTPAGDAYTSWEQVKADMAKPEYKNGDRAFHAMVDAKLSRSKI